MKRLLLLILTEVTVQLSFAQISKNDSLAKISFSAVNAGIINKRKEVQSFIVPTAMIAYGFIALENDGLLKLDSKIKEQIWNDNPHHPIKIDNYLQYGPATLVYGLNMVGIKGKNRFIDRSIIYLIANSMMGITVQSLKAITKVQRPDGYGTNAFPSGHTATAFTAAEFLRLEYKDVSPWYGVAGYSMAIATAYLRMYNNKHWFRDLLPGAGIGILSTRAAYWLYPTIKKIFFKNKPWNTIVVPFYQNGAAGVSFSYSFHK
jgi:hypothetical protein